MTTLFFADGFVGVLSRTILEKIPSLRVVGSCPILDLKTVQHT